MNHMKSHLEIPTFIKIKRLFLTVKSLQSTQRLSRQGSPNSFRKKLTLRAMATEWLVTVLAQAPPWELWEDTLPLP